MVTRAGSTRTEGRTPLTRERVLTVAVALADRDGIDGLSMRKLGQELGVDAMALYRHVKSKDDLLDAMVEMVVGEIERVEPDGPWKPALRGQVMAARQVMLRHPWMRLVLEERGTAGVAIIGYVEGILAILLEGGFTMDLAHHTLHVLGSRIFGFSQDLFDDSGKVEPSPEAAAKHRSGDGPVPARRGAGRLGQSRGRPGRLRRRLRIRVRARSDPGWDRATPRSRELTGASVEP